MKQRSLLLLLILCTTVVVYVKCLKSKKVHLDSYSINILSPVSSETSNQFIGTAERDSLVCFGNDATRTPSYLDTLGCMLFLPFMNCESIWGSRTVVIDVNGSVEFYRVNGLPVEEESSSLNATRWLHVIDSQRYCFFVFVLFVFFKIFYYPPTNTVQY